MSVATAPRRSKTPRPVAPAHLGLVLKTVLVSPGKGFAAALATTAKRERAGARPPEGLAPTLFTALAGVAAMLAWLKVGVGRSVAANEFHWGFLTGAAVAGACIALAARAVWVPLARRLAVTRGDVRPAPSVLRLLWGASALAPTLAVLLLLPFDFIITGTRIFTSARIEEPLAAGWAAVSLTTSVGLIAWSGYLLYRGAAAATLRPAVALMLAVTAAVTVTLLGLALAIGASTLG